IANPINIEATGLQSNVTLGAVTATDSLGNPITVTNNAPATFPVGTTTVTYTATDIYGNIATTTQAVIVADTTVPTINIQQAAVTIEAISAQTTVNLGTVTATDLVDGAITSTNNAPATFPLGITTVTWSATDAAGNTATAQQQVTVQDTTPPVITAPAAVTGISQDGYAVAVNIGQATATDAFNPVSIINDAPATFPIGNTTVTWSATDANNNSATATQLVTVTDNSIFANLPPDPGAAGKVTLAGIDSDNDGVRDDVQRWIVINYPNSQKTREALMQMAKAKQIILMGAANAANARINADIADNAAYCLTYVREQILGLAGSDAYNIKGELRAVYLNTLLRTKAWLQHDSHLGGMFFTVPADLKQGCAFNPDVMPN
ncbi:MAG: HYR domain-containing protein, partial [Ghiorsea sp.]|nr:HYR domain-containing protein [Ghiorsea sp.]